MMDKSIGIIVFCLLILISLCGWFFTLIVDLSMLIVLGYAVTFVIYRVFARKWKWIGVYAVLLLPINIIALWLGGILPYFDVARGEQVYFHLVPTEYIGESGNDFMWNGLILPWIGRIVPLEMTPTYQYLPFTILAIIVWVMMPVVLVRSCLYAWVRTMEPKPWYKIFIPDMLRMIFYALITLALVVGAATLLVKIYN